MDKPVDGAEALAREESKQAMPWDMVSRLRDEEADSITILCDNPDGPPNNAVECCGFWTGFADKRFEGDTVNEALASAVAAKDHAATIGYPDVDYSPSAPLDVKSVLEALQWAVDHFDGNTRCNAQQEQNCIEKCRDALTAARTALETRNG